jgi:hypothetical protein
MLVRVWWRWPLVRRQQHPEASARTVLVNRHRSLLRRRFLEARYAGRGPEPAAEEGSRRNCWWSGRLTDGSRPASGQCWCCATTRTCPSRRSPGCWRIPVGTVKSTTSRAMARLRRNLAQAEPRAGGRRAGAASASSGYTAVTAVVPAT